MLVRALKCPKCGGTARIPHGQQEAQCMHCGEPVRLSQAVMQEQARAGAFPHQTPLRLGMKGQFRGREYEAAGRQVMRQTDEGEVSTWEEWVLVSPDGDLLYLEYDEGRWKLSEPFVPANPVGPAELQAYRSSGTLNLDGNSATITDSGTYEVAHAEGEFPWLVVPGRSVEYADAGIGSRFYCVEWTEDEVEYYRGEFLDTRSVLSMFGMHAALTALDRQELVLRSRRMFGALCFILGVVGLVVWGGALASAGRVVPNGTGTALLGRVGQEGVRFGPIQLTSVGRVHRLDLQGHLTQESIWVGAVLEDENEQELISADRDMWDETGYDSDGAWHESDLRGSTHFVLRQPGNYYVRLYAEPEIPGSQTGAQASFTLRERVIYPNHLAWFGFLSLIAGIVFLLWGAPTVAAQIWEKVSESDD